MVDSLRNLIKGKVGCRRGFSDGFIMPEALTALLRFLGPTRITPELSCNWVNIQALLVHFVVPFPFSSPFFTLLIQHRYGIYPLGPTP